MQTLFLSIDFLGKSEKLCSFLTLVSLLFDVCSDKEKKSLIRTVKNFSDECCIPHTFSNAFYCYGGLAM